MIIDVHTHFGINTHFPEMTLSAEQLVGLFDGAGIDRGCASHLHALYSDIPEGNRKLLEAMNESEKLLGYVTVNPLVERSWHDLKLLEDNDRLIGIKLHPDIHGYQISAPKVRTLLKEASRYTNLVMAHTGGGNSPLRPYLDLAKEFKDVNFIAAHMGIPLVPKIMSEMFEPYEIVPKYNLDNVYFDTSNYVLFMRASLEGAVKRLGTDRVLFATDMPIMEPTSMIARIENAEFSQSDKAKILGGNAQRLLKL